MTFFPPLILPVIYKTLESEKADTMGVKYSEVKPF